GVGIAFALWWAFKAGDKISQLMFSFARPQVDMIYGMKDGTSGRLISLLLLLIIGPAEEIFWRGYVQRTLAAEGSADKAFIITTLAYTLVHIPSLNPMLILAAMVCGIAWGGLYRLFPDRLPAIILSHALWDAAAFVWFPL
ncbi:MAG: CPBP family intramembrane metalloprotease, partial [Bacteroidales bacterium]|nr:CPBP family intramembrane metalloprotease [Bacteroidales bacterium]